MSAPLRPGARGVLGLAGSALVVLAGGGCERSPAPPTPATTDEDTAAAPSGAAWFERVANDGGIDFTHDSGFRGRHLMPSSLNGGAALFDMDGDGDLDAYLVQGGDLDPAATRPPNQLFRNRGDGTFDDVTAASGAGDRGRGMGVACADVNGDGHLDLYVTNLGPNVLLLGDGAGGFRDATADAGIGDTRWSTGAVFFDADGDGDLDLFVCNYLRWSAETELSCVNTLGTPDYCKPTNYDAAVADAFYLNRGDGTFEDASERAGISGAAGTGLAALAGDFDDDGDLDVFVANDAMPDHFWINDGTGRFRNTALLAGCAVSGEGKATASMGVSAPDVDDDGDLDLLVVNISGEADSLFRNDGGLFMDQSARFGLGSASRAFTRFGQSFRDFDHDGRLDLFIACGRVMQKSRTYGDDPYAEPNLLFRGTETARFTEVEPRGGTTDPLYASSRGAAFGDVDGDGDIDVLVVNRDARAHLLRNVAPKHGPALRLRLLDHDGRDALHAIVRVTLDGRSIRRDVRPAESYFASSTPVVHIGLGDATVPTDATIRWPDGREDTVALDPPGAVQVIRQSK